MTMADADRYQEAYVEAIHAIGRTSAGRGVYDGPGISVKLSALHPRYSHPQRARVMAELLPRLKALLVLAKGYDIGLNIDAEEAERLEISLDMVEALALDPDLAGWNGLGFVVQAYQKRCPFVIDWLVDLARRSGSASWCGWSRAHIGIPKSSARRSTAWPATPSSRARCIPTSLTWRAQGSCWPRPELVYPQFATHNALHARGGLSRSRRQPTTNSSACTAWARRLYDKVVGATEHGAAVPHLRTGRLARDAAGLPGAASARKRRQLLVRQPDRRPGGSARSLVEDPVTASKSTGGSPHPRMPMPSDCIPTGEIRAASILRTSSLSLSWKGRSTAPATKLGAPVQCSATRWSVSNNALDAGSQSRRYRRHRSAMRSRRPPTMSSARSRRATGASVGGDTPARARGDPRTRRRSA